MAMTTTARRATLNAMVRMIWTAVRERPPRTVSLMMLSNQSLMWRDWTEPATTTGCKIPSGDRWIDRLIIVKVPADEGSLVPSFLKVAPGSCPRAQRNMDHGSKTLAPTPSNEPEATAVSPDPGLLSRDSVGLIPDVLEQCGCNSLTRASAGQSAQNRETLETRGVIFFRGSSLRSLAMDADASFDALVLEKRRLHLA